MKFLAILRDSLLEAIDLKVFYVMVGLSAFLIVLALTVTFTPAGEAKEFMEMAAGPLNVNLDEAGLTLQDPNRLAEWLVSRLGKGGYTVVRVEAVDGADNHPDSRYRVVLRGVFILGDGRALDLEEQLQQVREGFGRLFGSHLVEVTEARVLSRKAGGSQVDFELTTAPSRLTKRLWKHKFSLLFGLVPLPFLSGPLAGQLFLIENTLVNFLGATIALLVSVVITAFFIPNMLRKGTVDLLLVKPIRRPTLLLYKYVGGLTFIFLNTALAVGGVWLALSVRAGVWAPGFLMSIPIITFYFAILYSLSTLFGVLTRSPVAAILLTCLFWFFLFILGTMYAYFELEVTDQGRQALHEAWESSKPKEQRQPYKDDGLTPDERRREQGWFKQGVRRLHFILPRTSELGQLTSRYLLGDLVYGNPALERRLDPSPVSWGETLTVSGIFIAVMLGLACWRFSTRDY
jgi:ABC-type transport system involved in multi-copper enzyme maturation permease subunit